jgi:hypothetical protein
MKLFVGHNEVVLDWLSKRVDFELHPQTYLLWAATDFNGPLLGAMGFGGLMGKTWGSVSIALEDPRAALPLVRAATRLIFGVHGGQAAYINISANRAEWIHSLKNTIGFQEVDLVPDGLKPNEDLVLLKLTPETCRPWQSELRKLSRMGMREVA